MRSTVRGQALFSRWTTDTGRRALVILGAGETPHQRRSGRPHEFGVVVCLRIPLAEATEAPAVERLESHHIPKPIPIGSL